MHSASELQIVTGSIVQTGAGFGSDREAGASIGSLVGAASPAHVSGPQCL